MKQLQNYFIVVSSWLIFTIAETKWDDKFWIEKQEVTILALQGPF
jgi:hypothetical protein